MYLNSPMSKLLILTLCILTFSCYQFESTRSESATATPLKTCVNPEKKEVDWFIMFLFPETSNRSETLSYGYFDETLADIKYYNYNEANFPGLSLLKSHEEGKTNFFFWNDDITSDGSEKNSSSSKAHSKGGLIFDETKGFLFSHSLPRFPWRSADNTILNKLPPNAGIYGQSFICISMDKQNSLKIVETLNIINPQLVIKVNEDKTQIPADPQVTKLIKNRGDTKLIDSKITEILSRRGNSFQVFSKSKEELNLPYDFLIPNHYQDGLYVETWTKPEMESSICAGQFKIYNVQEVTFGSFKFNMNQEHSKWAVGIEKDVCCFGDLNRTGSQKKRGGNTICFLNKTLANIMRKAIIAKDDCKVPKFLKFLS